MTTLQFITTALIVIAVFILIISGKARTLLKAFFNLFVEDMASTPEGADALYRQKEEATEEKFHNADEVFKGIAGKKSRCANELKELKAAQARVEQQCESLAKKHDEESLDIKIKELEDIIDDIALHEKALKQLEAAHKAALDARNACEEALAEVRKERKKVVNQMKQDRDMKSIYSDLEGIGANTDIDKLLSRVREKSNDMNDMANGAREAYEQRTSTKVKQVEQRIRTSQGEDYKKKLMEKYKNQ